MSYLFIFILAFALSIDAMTVSFSYGIAYSDNRLKNSLLLAGFTGFFQGLMPVIGYYMTSIVKAGLLQYADWIVFLIFTYLGIKFIIEAFEKQKEKRLCIDLKCLLLIGIATSIDAFSAGVSLSLYGNKIFKPALLIAFVTFVNSQIGFNIGAFFKTLSTKWMLILGGVLLIFLGIKVFL